MSLLRSLDRLVKLLIGQIDGTSGSAIADPSQSILSWMGGNMPKGGPSSNAAATTDIEAWAAAGAQND